MRKIFVAMAVTVTFALALIINLRAQGRQSVLDAAAKAMGAENLTSVQYTGTGTSNAFGQAYTPATAWPAFKVTRFTASINYATPAMHVEVERTNPDGPIRGGGGLPLAAPQKQSQAVSGRVAWNINPSGPATPAVAATGQRLTDLWTTPHGVIKAALANNATVAGRVLTFTVANVPFKVTIGADNLVQKVETRADAPVLGDTVTETTYSMYKDFNGVKFPTRIVQKQGGYPVLDLTISDVKANIPLPLDVPDNVRQAANQTAPQPPVTVTKVADGVYYLAGGSHYSMAVEFKDYSAIFEAPLNDDRTVALIDAVHKAIPNKPIRYVINSHNHFDHNGGIRAVMAEGITIITQAQNKAYYERVAKMPHTINPDRLAKAPKAPVIETVAEKRVLTDGSQTLEIYHMPTNHTGTMLVGYLPKQKILYEVDLFNGPAPNAQPDPAGPATVAFYDELTKMKLDVQQILPGHGAGATTFAALKAATDRAAKAH